MGASPLYHKLTCCLAYLPPIFSFTSVMKWFRFDLSLARAGISRNGGLLDVPLLKKPIGHILLSGLEFLASRQFVLKAVPVNKIQTTIQKTRMDRLWRLRVGRMWRFVQSKKLE